MNVICITNLYLKSKIYIYIVTLEFYYTFYFKSEKRSKVKFCKFSALEFRHILRKKTFTTVLKNILNDRGKQKQSLDLLSHNTITAYFFPLDIP